MRYQATVVQSAGVASQLGKIDISGTFACVIMRDKKSAFIYVMAVVGRFAYQISSILYENSIMNFTRYWKATKYLQFFLLLDDFVGVLKHFITNIHT